MTEYEEAFDKACNDLEVLLRQRKEIKEHVRTLQKTLLALANQIRRNEKREVRLLNILEELDAFTPRITDAVKDALYSAYSEIGPRKLPPVQVKELLEIRGFDFHNLVNPLASVHSTLRRLAAQKMIGVSRNKLGETVYWWKGPHYGARTSLANVLETDRRQSKEMQDKIGSRIHESIGRLGT